MARGGRRSRGLKLTSDNKIDFSYYNIFQSPDLSQQSAPNVTKLRPGIPAR
jgi:hypothetical protein